MCALLESASAGQYIQQMDGKRLRGRTRRRLSASAVDVTAQVMYHDLVKGSLSPALRELGFKGSEAPDPRRR